MGNTIYNAFGAGAGLNATRTAGPTGRARQAFARLFAATSTLTGAALTARTVARDTASPGGKTGRSVASRSAGCTPPAEGRNCPVAVPHPGKTRKKPAGIGAHCRDGSQEGGRSGTTNRSTKLARGVAAGLYAEQGLG